MRGAQWLRKLLVALLSASSLAAHAQGPPQPVQWTGTVKSAATLTPRSKLSIELSATVQSGWHVYGFAQSSGGPIPLKIVIEENPVLAGDGAITGTPPVKKHDAAFDLDIESYNGAFTLRVPAQVKDHPIPGRQSVSVAVRFQACSDRTCLPPKTVHVVLPVEIAAGS